MRFSKQTARVIIAYILDRADQHIPDDELDGERWDALYQVALQIARGDAFESDKHGELSDLYEQVDRMMTRYKQ